LPVIAKAAPARSSGRGSFTDLRAYLERDDLGQTRADLLASWSGNVANHRTADIEMEAIARRGRCKDPVYHVILSWRPDEVVPNETLRGGIDATLRSLGAEDHQWYAAAHADESDGRHHLHLAINKTHPTSYKALDRAWDKAKLARATEWVEAEYGCEVDRRLSWRERLPELDLGLSHEQAHEHIVRSIARGIDVAPPGRTVGRDGSRDGSDETSREGVESSRDGSRSAPSMREMDTARRAGYSWVTLLQREAGPAIVAAAAEPGARWADVHAAAETYGVHFERAGSGLRILGPEIGQRARASRVGIAFAEMEQALGAYEACAKEQAVLADRLPAALSALKSASSWGELHAQLAESGLAVEQRGRGGRLLEVRDDGESVPLGRLGTSLPRLEGRFGEYVEAPLLAERREREDDRRTEGIGERLALIAREPGMVIDRMAAHHSVWTRADIEGELARMVGTDRRELVVSHKEAIAATVGAVETASLVLGTVRSWTPQAGSAAAATAGAPTGAAEKREPLMTTVQIAADERGAVAAFDRLRGRSRSLELRAPSEGAGLDEQQRRAYAYLADGATDLRVLTGIAGAGKSRLLRDVSAAYAEAGYAVVGAAVAGDAARNLGHEADIPAVTVARLLSDVERGRMKLTPQTVVILDEATQLGTTDGRRLAESMDVAGARLLATGDLAQHESVARGPIMAEVAERVDVADLSETRRAKVLWLRQVGQDMREGRTTRAIDALRERGRIGEYETKDHAMYPLVERYAKDVRAGRETLMVANARRDVDELNVRARKALADRLGEARAYATAYGEREFAIGESVVTRRGVRGLVPLGIRPREKLDVVNGERWTVAAHRRDGRIELMRDGAAAAANTPGEKAAPPVRVAWDLAEHPEIDYAYATTSYRAQGRTVDSVYVLATSSDARRGLYVDVTRAREDVLVTYAREDVQDFGRLLDVGGRERAKLTVAGAERHIEAEARREREEAQRSLGRRGRVAVLPMTQATPKPEVSGPEVSAAEPVPAPGASDALPRSPVGATSPEEFAAIGRAALLREQAAARPQPPSLAERVAAAQRAAREELSAQPPVASTIAANASTLPFVPIARLRDEVSAEVARLTKLQIAAESEVRRATEEDPYRRHYGKPEPRTAEEIVARRLERFELSAETAESRMLAQRREKNDGFLGLTRSAEQRLRDERTEDGYVAATREYGAQKKQMQSPFEIAKLQRTLAEGAEARRELSRSYAERGELVGLFRDLETVGVREVQVRPDAAGGGLSARVGAIVHAAERAREPHADRLAEIEQARAIEREQRAVEQKRERGRDRGFDRGR